MPSDYNPRLSDFYDRDQQQLLASLSHYCHQIQDGVLVMNNEDLTDIIPTITRFCDDASLPDDFEILLQRFPPDDIPSRSIFDWNLIENDPDHILSMLEEITLHDQIIFYRVHENGLIAIYFVMVPWHTIEIYAAGTIAMDKIDSDASAIAHFLCAVHPHCTTIQNRLRLHTPNNLPVNKTIMAYVLVKELHC